MTPSNRFPDIPLDRFMIESARMKAERIGGGHIHETYRAEIETHDGAIRRYTLQRINQGIFRTPATLMENICRVTDHIRMRLRRAGTKDLARRVLSVVPARDGSSFVQPGDGSFWRAYHYIDDSHSLDAVPTPAQACAAARAFATFQKLLSDFPATRLEETIHGFHDTPARMKALMRAVDTDALNRATQAKEEIDFSVQREPDTAILREGLRAGRIPERITHNDTKINNVLFDNRTGEALCVIDLDTVMPGLAPHDFGDLVRTAASSAAEDERDLSKVGIRLDLYRSLAEGYLSVAVSYLTPGEIDALATAARVITLETGIRFLTDYLEGDTYFKVHRPAHNLDRARNQFRLLECMESETVQLERIIKTAADRCC